MLLSEKGKLKNRKKKEIKYGQDGYGENILWQIVDPLKTTGKN